jgi:hypothetical protein
MGLLASIVFVVGILSLSASSSSKNNEVQAPEKWEFASSDSLLKNSISSLFIDIDHAWAYNRQLIVKYGKDKQDVYVPITAFSSRSGFVYAAQWKPVKIYVKNAEEGNRFEYTVIGYEEWKLLGITVYKQYKDYSGAAMINEPRNNNRTTALQKFL